MPAIAPTPPGLCALLALRQYWIRTTFTFVGLWARCNHLAECIACGTGHKSGGKRKENIWEIVKKKVSYLERSFSTVPKGPSGSHFVIISDKGKERLFIKVQNQTILFWRIRVNGVVKSYLKTSVCSTFLEVYFCLFPTFRGLWSSVSLFSSFLTL